MKIVTIVGARPQFIKAAVVSEALRRDHEEILVHTGQHYDDYMSAVFFEELSIPRPDYHLEVGSGPHGWQTGMMLTRIEEVLLETSPDWLVVFGDTNSTVAGALAAAKLNIPVAHVEAGLRSFNRLMPEEHNRVLTDHCSELLFCPTSSAVDNLAREGMTEGVFDVGDVMFDAALKYGRLAQKQSTILEQLDLCSRKFVLATVHRAYNTDDPERLSHILTGLNDLQETVIFPLHPRTRKRMAEYGLNTAGSGNDDNIRFISPLGYLDFLMLEQNARIIVTDSGGIQKESYFFAVPCVTIRPETEWSETVTSGWNVLVDTDVDALSFAVHENKWPEPPPPPVFGTGDAAEKIAWLITNSGSQ